MGQRTHLVIVADDQVKNKQRVSIFYNHWGIGRIMPMSLMTLIPQVKWGYDTYTGKDFLEYSSLNYLHLGYSFERKLNYTNGVRVTKNKEDNAPKNFEDWKYAMKAGEYMRNFNNNNGCLFVFITHSKNADYDYSTKIEIAWMIGSEDAYRPEWKSEDGYSIKARKEENKRLGEAYCKWLSTRQWMSLDVNERWWTHDKEFKELFNRFLAYYKITPHKEPQKAKDAA